MAEARTTQGAARMLAALLFGGVGLLGCAPRHEPIFEPLTAPPTWPPSPDPARIRYVGMIETAADMKPPRQLLAVLGDLLAGEAPTEPLYGPRSIAVTSGGRYVWVGDPGGRCVHRFDLESRSYMKITHGGEQRLLSPVDIGPGPDGTLLVCDSENVAIYRYAVETGAFLGGLRLPEEIRRPTGVAFDVANKRLFVVDVSAHDLKVLDGEGRLLWVIGRRGQEPGAFNFPCDVALDGDTLWVADTGNQRIQHLTPQGKPLGTIGQLGDAPGDLALPKAITLDGDGHVYVVDARFENIQVFDRTGQLLLVFGDEGSGPGEFWLPGGLFMDNRNRLWVCDTYNARVQVFDYVPDVAPAAGKEESE